MAGHKQKQVNNSTSRSSINQHQQHSNNNQSNNQHDHHQQQPPQRHLQTSKQPIECFNCHKPIRERFLLKALDQYWHEDCLKCSCCDCRLGEVGSTLFTKANLILCKRDYLRLFGNTGYCSACNKTIPGFEMVMKAKSNVYHLECFSCFQCHQKFCVGDRFYLFENKILCEYDYEERMLFASLSRNNITTNNSNNFIDSIQRHQPHQQQQQQQQSLSLSQSSHHHQQQHSQYHHSQQPTHNHQQQPSSSSMHPYLNNHSNHSHNQPLSHHNHHQQQQPQQQQQQPLNKMDGDALCDASSGYGSGDSPFDH